MPDITLMGATYYDVPGVTLPISGGGTAYFMYPEGVFYNNAAAHNSIYRGKNIGSSLNLDQLDAITLGTFEDMYIGDYWEINNIIWRIAGINYWLGTGSETECTTPHVVVVPDVSLTDAKMNSTNVTTNGYFGSDFYNGTNGNTGKSQCWDIIKAAFGEAHILSHEEFLTNTVTNGFASAGGWYTSTFELMTEQMVHGSRFFSNELNGTALPANYTIDGMQLPLFFYNHAHAQLRENWWLRDVSSGTQFAAVGNNGLCHSLNAGVARGIRPVFGICA